jgi:hypothetical protein
MFAGGNANDQKLGVKLSVRWSGSKRICAMA